MNDHLDSNPPFDKAAWIDHRFGQLLKDEPRFAQMANGIKEILHGVDHVERSTSNDHSVRLIRVRNGDTDVLYSLSCDIKEKRVSFDQVWFNPTHVIKSIDQYGVIETIKEPRMTFDFSSDAISSEYITELWEDLLVYADAYPNKTSFFSQGEPVVIGLDIDNNLDTVSDILLGWNLGQGAQFKFSNERNETQEDMYTVGYLRDGTFTAYGAQNRKIELSYIRLIPDGLPEEIGRSILPIIIIDAKTSTKDLLQHAFLNGSFRKNIPPHLNIPGGKK